MYRSAYASAHLDALARTIAVHRGAGTPVWCIFDNTAEGAATADAVGLLRRILPATRMTNKSPTPWSNRISAGARESEHDSTMANGLWPADMSPRSSWLWARGQAPVKVGGRRSSMARTASAWSLVFWTTPW